MKLQDNFYVVILFSCHSLKRWQYSSIWDWH